MQTTFSCSLYHSLPEMLSVFSFYEVGITFSCCLYWFLKTILSAFSFHEIRTTFLGCLYFQVVIRINIWKINVVRIFFWWNADNILSCPHVVRLSVVVRILSIPRKNVASICLFFHVHTHMNTYSTQVLIILSSLGMGSAKWICIQR